MRKDLDARTRAAHAGSDTPVPVSPRPAVPPIYQSSVFVYDDLEQVDAIQEGRQEGFLYTRLANPGQRGFELALANIEGAEDAACMASGMGAITASLVSLVSAGEHIVASHELYGGTYGLLTNELARLGVATTFVDPANPAAVKQAFTPDTRVLYLETISNPTVRVTDIEALSAIAHRHRATVLVDNTFASPYLAHPLEWGADLSIHSATKYISGHSTLTGGAVVGSAEKVARVRKTAVTLGATLSPFDAWLAVMGLKTLAIRMERSSANALELARYLQDHRAVKHVNYPGLPQDPLHTLASRMMPRGFGGMLSFDVAGGPQGAARVMAGLKLCHIVPSLAGVTTTTSHPAKTSHRSMPPERRAALGISESLVRVSTGVEHAGDIIADFEQALAGV